MPIGDCFQGQRYADVLCVEEGAAIPLRLGFGDIGGISGEYWANESTDGKGDGTVSVW